MPATKRNRKEKTKGTTMMRKSASEERAEDSGKGMKKDIVGARQKKTDVGE